jgi:hypothetical protein
MGQCPRHAGREELAADVRQRVDRPMAAGSPDGTGRLWIGPGQTGATSSSASPARSSAGAVSAWAAAQLPASAATSVRENCRRSFVATTQRTASRQRLRIGAVALALEELSFHVVLGDECARIAGSIRHRNGLTRSLPASVNAPALRRTAVTAKISWAVDIGCRSTTQSDGARSRDCRDIAGLGPRFDVDGARIE